MLEGIDRGNSESHVVAGMRSVSDVSPGRTTLRIGCLSTRTTDISGVKCRRAGGDSLMELGIGGRRITEGLDIRNSAVIGQRDDMWKAVR